MFGLPIAYEHTDMTDTEFSEDIPAPPFTNEQIPGDWREKWAQESVKLLRGNSPGVVRLKLMVELIFKAIFPRYDWEEKSDETTSITQPKFFCFCHGQWTDTDHTIHC